MHPSDTALGSLRLDELASFVAVAEARHFGRAAEDLHLTTGGLSRRIARLERVLQTPLLRRTTRHISLTPAGEALLPVARGLMDQVRAVSTVLVA